VANRANTKPKDLSNLKERTVNSLPDLNYSDEKLKSTLLNEFGVDLDTEEYAYVD
jgi:hypothetical protein